MRAGSGKSELDIIRAVKVRSRRASKYGQSGGPAKRLTKPSNVVKYNLADVIDNDGISYTGGAVYKC